MRNDEITLDEIAALEPERIVISPGPCTPSEAGISVPLIRDSPAQMPILGVCLGHQASARFRRARRAAPARDARQDVADRARGQRRLRRAAITFQRHALSFAGRRARQPAGRAGDHRNRDDGEIMGVRHRSYPVEGVQFHPESILTEHGQALLANFLEAA